MHLLGFCQSLGRCFFLQVEKMAELKNIRIAISGIYDYAQEELPSLQLPGPGSGAPDWVKNKRIYKVYRPASVLAAACDKFKMLPLTHHHPRTPVDGQNFRDLTVGYTGENPWLDYLDEKNEVGIRSTLMIYDEEALSAYNNGEIQLSPGYIARFEWKQGTSPNGQDYDIIMREITDVNHLALLPAGRGGDDAVVMDSAAERVTVFDLVQGMKDGAPSGYIVGLNKGYRENGKLITTDNWIVTSFKNEKEKVNDAIASAVNFPPDTSRHDNLFPDEIIIQKDENRKSIFEIARTGTIFDLVKK